MFKTEKVARVVGALQNVGGVGNGKKMDFIVAAPKKVMENRSCTPLVTGVILHRQVK